MFMGKFKVKSIKPINNVLQVEAISLAEYELQKDVSSYSFDSTDGSFDTWTEVAKNVIDTQTLLDSSRIDIKDASGTAVASEDTTWDAVKVKQILYDIGKYADAYLVIDSIGNPMMGTYEAAKLNPVMLQRSLNLVNSDINSDSYSLINSCSAQFSFTSDDGILISQTAQTTDKTTYQKYHCHGITIPTTVTFLDSIDLYLRKGSIDPVDNFEVRLLYDAARTDQFDPPGWVADLIPNTNTTKAVGNFTTSYQWLNFTFAAPINATNGGPIGEDLRGKMVFIAIKDNDGAGGNPLKTYEIGAKSVGGWGGTDMPTATEDPPTAGWVGGGALNAEFAYKLNGDQVITVSGSDSDTNSIDKHGTYHRNVIAKTARSDAACAQFTNKLVARYKEGILKGDAITHYHNFLYPGRRVIILDQQNQHVYEDLFVSAVKYGNDGLISLELSEPEINVDELVVQDDAELYNTDRLLLV